MLLQSAHFPGQQLHLAAAVIIIVLAWKKKQTKQAESISVISEMFFATIIGIAGYVLMLICQLSVYKRLMKAMCHQ